MSTITKETKIEEKRRKGVLIKVSRTNSSFWVYFSLHRDVQSDLFVTDYRFGQLNLYKIGYKVKERVFSLHKTTTGLHNKAMFLTRLYKIAKWGQDSWAPFYGHKDFMPRFNPRVTLLLLFAFPQNFYHSFTNVPKCLSCTSEDGKIIETGIYSSWCVFRLYFLKFACLD